MDSLQIISIPAEPRQPTSRSVPALFTNAGSDAARRFMECFTANIRNRHTRAAYARATARFARWCDARHVALTELTPVIVAAYIAELDLATVLDDTQEHTSPLRLT
jgi:site-specific recombinase XerD